jgi:hypothetical protein
MKFLSEGLMQGLAIDGKMIRWITKKYSRMHPRFMIPSSSYLICGAIPLEKLHLKLKLVEVPKTRALKRTVVPL